MRIMHFKNEIAQLELNDLSRKPSARLRPYHQTIEAGDNVQLSLL